MQPIMLTSHRLLLQYWHDNRSDIGKVHIWYTDRGAPDDRTSVCGTDISLESYFLIVRTADGEKPVPYHRILLITYDGAIEFENRRIRGLATRIRDEWRTQEMLGGISQRNLQSRERPVL